MQSKEDVERILAELRHEYGEWTEDIPLPHGAWTRGNLKRPQTRLKRILQVANDLSRKPLSQLRVLDLGCLDGIYAIEFAMHGAQAVGIEIREANIRKAIFCKQVLGLDNVEFLQQDVRNLSFAALGSFDIILCSGIFYHLRAAEANELVSRMFEMCERMVILDTHVALEAAEQVSLAGRVYWGKTFREHPPGSSTAEKEKKLWSSWGNDESFWFTRPSLVNMLTEAGFSAAYECFTPPHLNYGKPGIEHYDRCTFVAVKEQALTLKTSPAANAIQETWPEETLSYAPTSWWTRLRRSKRLRSTLGLDK